MRPGARRLAEAAVRPACWPRRGPLRLPPAGTELAVLPAVRQVFAPRARVPLRVGGPARRRPRWRRRGAGAGSHRTDRRPDRLRVRFSTAATRIRRLSGRAVVATCVSVLSAALGASAPIAVRGRSPPSARASSRCRSLVSVAGRGWVWDAVSCASLTGSVVAVSALASVRRSVVDSSAPDLAPAVGRSDFRAASAARCPVEAALFATDSAWPSSASALAKPVSAPSRAVSSVSVRSGVFPSAGSISLPSAVAPVEASSLPFGRSGASASLWAA